MKIKMTNNNINKNLEMSLKDEQERCRSLVCDPNGIIVAEMVYRCMICFYVSDTMQDARSHYVTKHIEEEDDSLSNDNSTDQLNNLEDLCQKNIPKHKKLHQRSDSNNSLENGLDYSMSSNKYRASEPIDMSPSSDSYDRYLPLVTISDDSGVNGLPNGTSKSGYVNCAVCNITRYYSCVQKRYGQYTCVTCYRNFKAFLSKPEKHECRNLGNCALNVRQRCKACWLSKCMEIFQIDIEKQQLIEQYAPLKNGNGLNINNSEEDEHTDNLDDGLDSNGSPIDDKMEQSDDNNNSINGLNGLNGHLNHSKDALSYMLALNSDLPTLLSKSSLNNFGLLNSNTNSLFGNLNVNDSNNNSLINHSNNSLNNQTNGLINGTTDNLAQNLFLSKHQIKMEQNASNKNQNSNSDLNGKNATANNSNGKSANAKTPNGVAKKKLWSCGKCATCAAEDCGKCIYCLDRPKFGGPFVKKQRCIKRRCLMKIKTKQQNKQQQQQQQQQQQNTVPTLSNTSYVF